jgi:hypothetical protein
VGRSATSLLVERMLPKRARERQAAEARLVDLEMLAQNPTIASFQVPVLAMAAAVFAP